MAPQWEQFTTAYLGSRDSVFRFEPQDWQLSFFIHIISLGFDPQGLHSGESRYCLAIIKKTTKRKDTIRAISIFIDLNGTLQCVCQSRPQKKHHRLFELS